MNPDTTKKTLLVTGGGSGIGKSIALAANLAGYRVGVLDRDLEAAQAVVQQLDDAVALAADVCKADEVRAAIQTLGSLDVVVNNAGILRTGPLLTQSPEDFRSVIDVNLNAVFVVSQAAAQVLQHGGGSIVNIASINGVHPSPNSGSYGPAKAGVMALTKQMAIEWGQLGIRVNAVAPGFVDTGMSTPFYADERVRKSRSAAVPLGRLGVGEDIAKAVMYLVSEDAAYVNGHTLTVDGGVVHSLLSQLPRT